jgi:hypothetical protein
MKEDGAFDERYYLALYPDVAQAVATGKLVSGYEHFVKFGKGEGRICSSEQVPIPSQRAGRAFATAHDWHQEKTLMPGSTPLNPMREYVHTHLAGPGIWKWSHYFDVYHRHCERFRGKEVHVLEIGIYSGGSLGLLREYFGQKAVIHGVDIQPSCKVYESDRIKVHIGDQSDRTFWKKFRSIVPQLDVVIDDGGHQAHQQMISLEELLPHLRPGGIYFCEDVHLEGNAFASYTHGMADALNAVDSFVEDRSNPERRLSKKTTLFQSAINCIAFYPFIVAIEKRGAPMEELVAPMCGSEWQPFLR